MYFNFYIIYLQNNVLKANNKASVLSLHVGYSESKYRLRISLEHPRDCHFVHV